MITKKQNIVYALGAGLLLVALALLFRLPSLGTKNSSLKFEQVTAKFFDRYTFDQAVKMSKEVAPQKKSNLVGGILPHHLVPIDLIFQYYQNLAVSKQPKTIIMIGPDHADGNHFGAVASNNAWQTQFGVINPEQQLLDQLVNQQLVVLENQAFQTEHSIQTHLHFIKYFWPDSQIVPIIFRSDYPQDKAEKLGQALSTYLNDDVLLLASIDFSHYLTAKQSQAHDDLTIKAIKSFDYDLLYSYNSDYFDSRASITTLLQAMEAQKAKDIEVMANTNSGFLINDYAIPSTSYFFLYFTR